MKDYFFNEFNQITIENNKIFIKKVDELLLLFFIEKQINPNEFYDNVIAISCSTGKLIWKVEKHINPKEKNGKFNSLGPFQDALPYTNKDYIVLTKAHGWKVLVNKSDGKIIRNIDLNTGNRPW